MARISVLDLCKKKADNERIVMVTAYDYTMARLVDASSVDMVLVGDSVGMVVQGHKDTLPVTLDQMVYHTQCVGRGLKRAHLTADLPFLSYQVSPEQALLSAGRLVQEGGAQSIKLEGGERSAGAIEKIVTAGIPVVGHVGLTPQSVHVLGGFKVQGRSDAAAEKIVRDAVAVQDAGAFCVVLEGVPTDVASEITERLQVPTIGIGAGPHCDGQVLVFHDLLGMDATFQPKFVKQYLAMDALAKEAITTFAEEVRNGTFPDESHTFHRTTRPRSVVKLG